MKKCPRCSVRYLDMWNICAACDIPLVRAKENVFTSIFTKRYPQTGSPLSLLGGLMDRADTLFLYLNKDLKPVICNDAIERITGYKREEIFKGDLFELLFRDNQSRKDMFKAVIDGCLASKQYINYEGVITRRDGGESVLLWRNLGITDVSDFICGVLCTAQDISEEEKSGGDITARYNRLRNIFSSIKDYALITTNLEEKITYYGIGSAELFGWEKDMTLQDISLLLPEGYRDSLMDKIRESIAKDKKFEEEVTLLKNGKEEFPAVLTVTALLDNDKNAIGYIYIAHDITERKKIERKMIQTEKLAAIGQLAAGVAHEMNNPLLVIGGRLDMLSTADEKLPVEAKRIVETVKAQTERMKLIVNRLLSYSRKRTPRKDTIDVNNILNTIFPLLSCYPECKYIRLEKELSEGLPKVKGDFNQLQEVFLNISMNACQAMPQGGVLTLRSEDKKDGFIEVSIKDTGIGIKEDNLKELFDPFFTTKEKGTGLGLVVCQNIIDSHGGAIEVESKLGEGTVFKIRLPIREA